MKTFKATLRVVFAFCLVSALLCVVTLSACGFGPSEATGTSEAAITPDEDVIREGVANTLGSVLAHPSDEFLSHVLRDTSFEVRDVTIAGNRAVVPVKITHLNVNAALKAAYERLERKDEALTVADLYHAGEEYELDAHLIQVFYDCLDSTEDMTATEVSIQLGKVLDEWHIDSGSLDKLVESLLQSE